MLLLDQGLYFINPEKTEKDIPVQIYTQGETEFNSVWFPTIDKPNQKTTEEISMTVLSKYITLSNGLLVNKKRIKMAHEQTHGKWICLMHRICFLWE